MIHCRLMCLKRIRLRRRHASLQESMLIEIRIIQNVKFSIANFSNVFIFGNNFYISELISELISGTACALAPSDGIT